MTEPVTTNDNLNLVGELAEAVTEANSREALTLTGGPGSYANSYLRRIAYEVAAAYGKCILYGVDPGDPVASLPELRTVRAAGELTAQLSEWTETARYLPKHLSTIGNHFEHDDACISFLDFRLEAWAVYLALDDAYQATLERGDNSTAAFAAMECTLCLMEYFDDALLAVKDLILPVVRKTEWINNHRALLAPEYTAHLPWWLETA